MSRGERRRTGGILSSRNNRTAGSRVLSWNQRVQRSLKSLLSRTSMRDTSRSNDEPNNTRITTDHQIGNPEQDSALAEKLSLSNPHLADGDMKDVEENNITRPQQEQEELLAMDGADGEM